MDRQTHREVLCAQVDAADAWRLRQLAAAEDRTVSAELRRLVRQRLAEADEADRLRAVYTDKGEQE